MAAWNGVYARQLVVDDAGAADGDYFKYQAATRKLVTDKGALSGRVMALETAMSTVGSSGGTVTQGPAGTVAVGSVTTGSSASVTNSGTPTSAVLDFVLPRGAPGASATIAVSSTTTYGNAATPVAVVNAGTPQAAELQFTFPDLNALVNPDESVQAYHDQLVTDLNVQINESFFGPIWDAIPGSETLPQNMTDGELISAIQAVRLANYLYGKLKGMLNARKELEAQMSALSEFFVKFDAPPGAFALFKGYQTGTCDGAFYWQRTQRFQDPVAPLRCLADNGDVLVEMTKQPSYSFSLYGPPLELASTQAGASSSYTSLSHPATLRTTGDTVTVKSAAGQLLVTDTGVVASDKLTVSGASPSLVVAGADQAPLLTASATAATSTVESLVPLTIKSTASPTLTVASEDPLVDPLLKVAATDGVNSLSLSSSAVAGYIESSNDLSVKCGGTVVMTAGPTGVSMLGSTLSTEETTMIIHSADADCVSFTPTETVFSAAPIVCQSAYYVSVDPASKLVTQAQLDEQKAKTSTTTGSDVASSAANLGGDLGTLFGSSFDSLGAAAVGAMGGAMAAVGLSIRSGTDPGTGATTYQVVQQPVSGGIAVERILMFDTNPLAPSLVYVMDATGLDWAYVKNVPAAIAGYTGTIAESQVTGLVADLAAKLDASTGVIAQSQVTGLTSALAGKLDAATGTIAESQVTGLVADLASKLDASTGTIAQSQVTGLTAALAGYTGTIAESQVTGLVADLASKLDASTGTIAQSQVTGLTAALAGKLDAATGTIAESQVTGLTSDLQGINSQLASLGASSAGVGVSKLDVETVTTNGATLSLTKSSYFAPGIVTPTGFFPGVHGFAMTYPANLAQNNGGQINASAVDASGNLYVCVYTAMGSSTTTNYIKSLNGDTSLQVAVNDANSSGAAPYVAKFDPTGTLLWAWKPLDNHSTVSSNNATCVGVEVQSNGHIQYVFSLHFGDFDSFNPDGTLRTSGFVSDRCIDYVQLTVNSAGAIVSFTTPVSTNVGAATGYNAWFPETMAWNGKTLMSITTAWGPNAYTTSPTRLYFGNTGPIGYYNAAFVYLNDDAVAMMANPIQLTASSEQLEVAGMTTDSSNNLFVSLLYYGGGGSRTINNLSSNSSSGHTVTLPAAWCNVVLWYNSSGVYVGTPLMITTNANAMLDIECDGSGNIYGYWATSDASVTVGGVTATSKYTPSGWLVKFTPTGTVSKLASCIDASALSSTWLDYNRRLMFDATNGLMFLCLQWGGTATGTALTNLDGSASSVVSPNRPGGTGASIFALNCSTDKWVFAFTPLGVATGHLTSVYQSYRAAHGKLLVNGYVSTDQTSLQVYNGDKTSTTSLTTDSAAYGNSTYQPLLLAYSYNATPMSATLPLPSPSSGNFLEKTLIMQPGLSYVLTEQNNAGDNTRTIPTAATGLTVVQYYYAGDAWSPDFSTVDLVNTVVYDSSSTTTTVSNTDAATLNGLASSQFVRSDVASGVSCASSTRAFAVNNQAGGFQVASFQSAGTEVLGVSPGAVAVAGSLTVSGGISGSLPWSGVTGMPTYIGYVSTLTSDCQSQLDALRTSSFLSLSGGTVSGTVTATSFIADGSITCQSLSTSGAVRIDASNPGPLVYTQYPAGVSDSYGLAQESSGRLYLYASSYYASSTIQLGFVTGAGTYASKVVVSQGSPEVAVSGSVKASGSLNFDSGVIPSVGPSSSVIVAGTAAVVGADHQAMTPGLYRCTLVGYNNVVPSFSEVVIHAQDAGSGNLTMYMSGQDANVYLLWSYANNEIQINNTSGVTYANVAWSVQKIG